VPTSREAKLDLKEEEETRNHSSSSTTTTHQNAPWKQELSQNPNASEST